MNESQMWENLNTRFKQNNVFAKRINDKAVGGVPDVVAVYSGVTAWIELKVAKVRPKSPPLINVRTDQALWMHEWRKHGGRAGVLVRVHPLTTSDFFWWFPVHLDVRWMLMWPNVTWDDLEMYPPKEFSAFGSISDLVEEIFMG
jgi:hypothetical protein